MPNASGVSFTSGIVRSVHGPKRLATPSQFQARTGTLTWYGASGFYVDGQAQLTWYRNDLTSDVAGSLEEDVGAFGYAAGVEIGQRIEMNGAWSVTPQAQLVYSSIDLDGFTDTFDAPVDFEDAQRLTGRLGLSAEHADAWQDEGGKERRSSVYGIANLNYDFLTQGEVRVDDVPFASEDQELAGGLWSGR